jgi:hypothetical protein
VHAPMCTLCLNTYVPVGWDSIITRSIWVCYVWIHYHEHVGWESITTKGKYEHASFVLFLFAYWCDGVWNCVRACHCVTVKCACVNVFNSRVYVWMCVYVCMYMFICMHWRMNMCLRVYVWICVSVCMYVWMPVCLRV